VDTAAHLEVKVGVEGFRIHNGGQDYVRRRDEPNALSPLEQQARAEGLLAYQKEMQAFATFLREKYFDSAASKVKRNEEDATWHDVLWVTATEW